MSEVIIRGEMAQKLLGLAQRFNRTVEDSLALLVDSSPFPVFRPAADTPFRAPGAEQRIHELESINQRLSAEVERLRYVEAQLRRHEEHLRIIFDTSDVGLVLSDSNGDIVKANPAFCRMLGYDECVLQGINFRMISDPDGLPHEMELLQAIIRGESEFYQIEKQLLTRHNTRVWVNLTISAHRDEQGSIQHFIGIIKDISEAKQMQEALSISEQRYRSVVTAMSEGVVLHSAEGQIIACNASAERILGLTADQIMGRTSTDSTWRTVHEDGSPFPGETHPAMVTLHTGEPLAQVVMGIHRPDESITWISINSQPVFLEGQARPHGVVVSFNDITERKRTEQQLFQMALEKERARILAQFIMDATHEFRNALAVISTHAYLLSRINETARRENHYQRVGWATQHISGLLDAMLEIVELENQPELRLQAFDLNELVEKIVGEQRGRFESKHQTVHLLRSEQPLPVRGDARRLRLALFHLIDNAHKFTGEGGTITISAAPTADGAQVCVSDTGRGMSQEVQARIFERFYRDDPARTVRGFGLGLTIAQKVIDQHRGAIAVESEVGQGSRFTVSLPWQNGSQ